MTTAIAARSKPRTATPVYGGPIPPQINPRHLDLAYQVAWKTYYGRGGGWAKETPEEAAHYGLIRALRMHDPNRGPIEATITHAVRWAVIRSMGRMARLSYCEPSALRDYVPGDRTGAARAKATQWPAWAPPAEELVGWLRGREREVATLVFLEGLTVRDAAQRLQIDRMTAARARSRAVARIRELIQVRFPDDFPRSSRGTGDAD